MSNLRIRHLSAPEIIRVHDRAVERFGGAAGIPDPGRVEAVLGRIISISEYENITDIPALCAVYCVVLARGHVFVDCNKRTAINSAILFGRRNGFFIHPRQDLTDVVVNTAAGRMDLAALTRYFRRMRFLKSHPVD